MFADLDGTLVDSLEVARSVFRRFLHAHGATEEEGEFDSLNGRTVEEIADAVAATHCLVEPVSEIGATFRSMLGEAYEAEVIPFRDASEVLHELVGSGVRLALVSAANRELIQRLLARFAWSDLFEVVVTGDDVARAKPDPAPYALALARSGAMASEVVVIEDSVHGAAAARAAGLTVMVVGSSATPTLTDALEQLR